MTVTAVTYTNPEILEPYPGSVVTLPYGFGPAPSTDKPIFYFDIDNCLYDKAVGAFDINQAYIHQFFVHELNLSEEAALELQASYNHTYGLAVKGLVINGQTDGLTYNAKVDDAMPLHGVVTPNAKVRAMLVALKKAGTCRMWLLTNAYKTHAMRMLSLMGVGDLFDGLTFSDYHQSPIVCKPMAAYFDHAFALAGIVPSPAAKTITYFVDDSGLNCKGGIDRGITHVVHYIEEEAEHERVCNSADYATYYKAGGRVNGIRIIRSILDLQLVCAELF